MDIIRTNIRGWVPGLLHKENFYLKLYFSEFKENCTMCWKNHQERYSIFDGLVILMTCGKKIFMLDYFLVQINGMNMFISPGRRHILMAITWWNNCVMMQIPPIQNCNIATILARWIRILKCWTFPHCLKGFFTWYWQSC